ncbi:adenosylcobinamide-GDP ribazoletransferase [Corynebacterium kozikiae]|uniref:adenosylcobinamide-GDP ribazoletransferase n=1 Tax=Corynebacterium kozikiae TaxID=2968469 RepID=UPI00211BABA6|nr:adenosylcobinamide-GDP ribazoletransferase [Corynebacterium sp. 76QC2CO]
MSGKAGFVEGEHGPAILEGPATALSWTTILPLRGATAFDRTTGARVLASLPVAGIAHGLGATTIAGTAAFLDTPAMLTAVLITAFMELFSRFMHLDGLADVADALGSYAPPARAREILADPATGLIGMASALLSLLAQIAGMVALLDLGWWWMMWAPVVLARIAAMVNCHAHFHPMSPKGFGALMVGTVKTWWIVAWSLAYLAAATPLALVMGAGAGGVGTLGCGLAVLGLAVLLARHCDRRFEGLNGDTTGFIMHLCGTAAWLLMAVVAGVIAQV